MRPDPEISLLLFAFSRSRAVSLSSCVTSQGPVRSVAPHQESIQTVDGCIEFLDFVRPSRRHTCAKKGRGGKRKDFVVRCTTGSHYGICVRVRVWRVKRKRKEFRGGKRSNTGNEAAWIQPFAARPFQGPWLTHKAVPAVASPSCTIEPEGRCVLCCCCLHCISSCVAS